MRSRHRPWLRYLQRALSVLVAGAMTLSVFLILPLMQAIGGPPEHDLLVRPVDTGNLPPPPPPEIEEEPPEEPEPEEPPQLEEQAEPLELEQLELALNPLAGGELGGDFAVRLLDRIGETEGEDGSGGALDRIFSMAELDRRPRVIFQAVPGYPPELRGRQATVYVVFMVDREGRVTALKVERSTDPAFERPALEAVRQWRFEPGTRKGEKVQFKMRVPITFNAG